MDRELWTLILVAIRRAAAGVGWNGGRRRPVYPNRVIVAMYAWAVWHDRRAFACSTFATVLWSSGRGTGW